MLKFMHTCFLLNFAPVFDLGLVGRVVVREEELLGNPPVPQLHGQVQGRVQALRLPAEGEGAPRVGPVVPREGHGSTVRHLADVLVGQGELPDQNNVSILHGSV